jgi:hypothetical protein
MLEEFGMSDCKGELTPMSISNRNIIQDDSKFEDITKYQNATGKLVYLTTCTRPDIGFPVSQVSKKMKDPILEDWKNIKRIFRYLKATLHYKITYGPKQDLIGYSDASYAADANDRKSHSGYIFTLNGGPISWKSKKQAIVSLSSMEAEYIALTETVKEGMWLQKLQEDLKLNKEALIIYEDNQSCIRTASDVIRNERSKHIDVRYHFVRELVNKKEVRLEYLPTEHMPADLMTKALGKIAHYRHVNQLLDNENTADFSLRGSVKK